MQWPTESQSRRDVLQFLLISTSSSVSIMTICHVIESLLYMRAFQDEARNFNLVFKEFGFLGMCVCGVAGGAYTYLSNNHNFSCYPLKFLEEPWSQTNLWLLRMIGIAWECFSDYVPQNKNETLCYSEVANLYFLRPLQFSIEYP